MKGFLPENRIPVSQAAKKALYAVSPDPLPQELFLIQLARWAMENLTVKPELRTGLKDQIELLAQMRPHHDALEWIIGKPQTLTPQDLSGKPEDAAATLIEHLNGRMADEFPNWPSKPARAHP